MSLHFKKDGSLDMRYSSSKAACSSSGYSGSGYSGSGGSSASYRSSNSAYGSSSYYSPAAGSTASTNLHYKKDGSLDMRYSSSQTAVAQQPSSASGYRGQGYSASISSPLYGTCYSSPQSNPYSSNDLHYKKDGSLDMRYASSKEVASLASGVSAIKLVSPGSGVHLKKDGSLDMRFSSSKQIASSGTAFYNIPASVPRKTDGTPDMRKKEAKVFVRQEAIVYGTQGILPIWVPKKKDGTIDGNKAIGREFLQAVPAVSAYVQPSVTESRKDYWTKRAMDVLFHNLLQVERQEPRPLPPPAKLISPQASAYLYSASSSVSSSTVSIPENVHKLDYTSLEFEGESTGVLGRGAFGIVRKATWNGIKVAVKVLHLTQLTKKEKTDFEKEIRILAVLGEHQNLVFLHGYCTDPPCIVMELVERGSLSYLLHYCDDPDIETKMTDGRVKKNLVYGTADGMHQLHVAKIVHGDLKPQNVLVTHDYTAKVTDFGLSTLRGKTSSTIHSASEGDDEDDDAPRGAVGGTSGYMAPELLDSISRPDFPIDVYSFGILLNEVVSEEEPYSDQYANFAARGPFGAANYAKLGKRPTINREFTPHLVENLICECWCQNPARRPTFAKVLATIRDAMFIIPDSINP